MNTRTRDQVLQIVKTAQEKGTRPDLSGVNLSQTNLSGANLARAYFIKANLSEANLNQANLGGADLSGAHLGETLLRGTNLGEAFLNQANLKQANLNGANLNRAHLVGANLSGANLQRVYFRKANLSGANLNQTDLRGADLSGANLVWADLGQTNLSEANLSHADLSEADLNNTDLSNVNLKQSNLFRVNFSSANLSGADLSQVDLSQADLSKSNLTQAHFNRANFNQTDFREAIVGLTSFGNIDLHRVIGLDSVKHRGPSTLGADTLYRSQGQLIDIFLRGCGLSDVQIETAKLNNPNLTFDEITTITNKIQELLLIRQTTHFCFVSYDGQDDAFVQILSDDLQEKGIRCWNTPKGTKTNIDQSIRLNDKLLLVLSKQSLNSSWIEKEVLTAFVEEDKRNKRVIFPIRLDETAMEIDRSWVARIRQSRPITDFSRWQEVDMYRNSFESLIEQLNVTIASSRELQIGA